MTDATFTSYQESMLAARQPLTTSGLRDYRIPVDDIAAKLRTGAPFAFVCTPHNPTGGVLDEAELAKLRRAADEGGGVLVVDEAYGEYAGANFASSLAAAASGRNVCVMKTFSKVAGLRVGYVVGDPEVIARVNRLHGALPYRVNRLAQRTAVAALADQQFVRQAVSRTAETRAHPGVVATTQEEPRILEKGHGFSDAWMNKGYFRWLIRGYGEMLSRAADFCDPAFRDSTDPLWHRDGRTIAIAGKDYGGHFVDPVGDGLVDGLDFSVGIDLGYGSGNRIIRLARRHPDKRFIGVDVDCGAVDVAREAVVSAGLDTRITIVHDDVRDLGDNPEYATADLAVSFFLGHDFWPREACLRTLAQRRRRLPRVRNFLFSDTYRSAGLNGWAAARLHLGFELTHALMGQHVPTSAEWSTCSTSPCGTCTIAGPSASPTATSSTWSLARASLSIPEIHTIPRGDCDD